jgi:hypothetical protein
LLILKFVILSLLGGMALESCLFEELKLLVSMGNCLVASCGLMLQYENEFGVEHEE